MSALEKLAYFQNRRDEIPNVQLAEALAQKKDKQAIAEIAAGLRHDNPNVQADCIKVLYEIGEREPSLLAEYAAELLKLLNSRNNRLVWGAMTGLSAIAELKAAELFKHRADIERVTAEGSVISADHGIKMLALIAAGNAARRRAIFPFLLEHLATCRPKDVPQRSEKIVVVVDASNRDEFMGLLERRLRDLSPSQAARVKKVIQQALSVGP